MNFCFFSFIILLIFRVIILFEIVDIFFSSSLFFKNKKYNYNNTFINFIFIEYSSQKCNRIRFNFKRISLIKDKRFNILFKSLYIQKLWKYLSIIIIYIIARKKILKLFKITFICIKYKT